MVNSFTRRITLGIERTWEAAKTIQTNLADRDVGLNEQLNFFRQIHVKTRKD